MDPMAVAPAQSRARSTGVVYLLFLLNVGLGALLTPAMAGAAGMG